MSNPSIYQTLNSVAIPLRDVPPSHRPLDIHGALYEGRSTIVFAIRVEDPSTWMEAPLPLSKISVVKRSCWDGPFSAPTYLICAPPKIREEARRGKPRDGRLLSGPSGEKRYYYGQGSAGLWHDWTEWRRRSGPFVSVREPETARLREERGFGCLLWMGIGGWSVLGRPRVEGRWIVEVGGDRWAADGWALEDGFPDAVGDSYERAKRDLAETMLGRSLSQTEFNEIREDTPR